MQVDLITSACHVLSLQRGRMNGENIQETPHVIADIQAEDKYLAMRNTLHVGSTMCVLP